MPFSYAEIEMICLREFSYLLKRSLKYSQLVTCMYARSWDDYPRSCLLRAAYCLVRYVDDILDRDRHLNTHPKQYVQNLLEQIQSGHYRFEDPISRLANYVMAQLDKLCLKEDNPKEEFLSLFRRMIFDWDRANRKIIYDEQALHTHHVQTLIHAQNITLTITGSKLRGTNVLDLTEAQGHLYVLRDIKQDLLKGIVNIPAEILNAAGLNDAYNMMPGQIFEKNAVKLWMKQELNRGNNHLLEFMNQLPALADLPARKVFKPLTRGLRYLTFRLKKRFADVVPVK